MQLILGSRYTRSMRRMLAIMLLVAFGSPLVAPLFAATADPEASLPLCCRSHGTHHCAMMHLMAVRPSDPAMQAPPCPYYPTPSTAPRTVAASLAASPQAAIVILRNRAALSSIKRHTARTSLPAANLKRGPPAIPA
jgi:hypothetical protein